MGDADPLHQARGATVRKKDKWQLFLFLRDSLCFCHQTSFPGCTCRYLTTLRLLIHGGKSYAKYDSGCVGFLQSLLGITAGSHKSGVSRRAVLVLFWVYIQKRMDGPPVVRKLVNFTKVP